MRPAIVVVIGGLLLASVAGCYGDRVLEREIIYQVQAPQGHDRSIAIVSGECSAIFGLGSHYTTPEIVITDEDGKVWNNNEPPMVITNRDGTIWKILFNGDDPDHWSITRENPNLGQKPVRVRAETLPRTVKQMVGKQ